MVAPLHTVAVLLLVFGDADKYGVEGSVGGTPANAGFQGNPGTDCYSSEFILSSLHQCLEDYSQTFLLSLWNSNIPTRLDDLREICREQGLLSGAYGCVFRLTHSCANQFRADAAREGDVESGIFLHDLEQYIPDPNLFVEAIRHTCQMEDLGAEVLCLMAERGGLLQLLKCETVMLKDLMSYLDRINGSTNLRATTDFKISICRNFEDLQRCIDGVTGCTQRVVSHMKRAFSFMTPPACAHADVTGKTGRAQSSHFHGEL